MTACLFTLAALTNAFLLFLVEPLAGKMVLPLLGGAPAVWNTVMLFFQTALLGGYLYAHVSGRLSLASQVATQAVVLAAMAALLPVGVPAGWVAPGVELPLASVFALVAVMAGGPFVALAAASPIIQRWFASTDHPRADDPYFLYAATNAGSLAGLLAYPFVVEPSLRVVDQAWVWTAGYAAAGALTIGCGLLAMRRARNAGIAGADRVPAETATPREAGEARPGWRERGRWLLLAFVPSSLMLGVTTHITTDIAAFPLLFVVPLALYLVTFVLAFARRQVVPWRAVELVFPLAALPVIYTYALEPTEPFWLLVPLHLACFFLIALGCHHWLARSRPSARHLTSYYLWIAAGGALGGVFNGVLAPLVFDTVLEYPLVVVLACFVRPSSGRETGGTRRVIADVVFALAAGAAVWPLEQGLALTGLLDGATSEAVGLGLVLVASSFVAMTPRRFALVTAALLISTHTQMVLTQQTLFTGRSYFGVMRVTEIAGGTRHLIHGSTIHGAQIRDGRRDLTPAAYYSPDGPAGDIMRQAGNRVAVVGLGTGAMACYARPNQEWMFFEIDPLVERIARDPNLFTYLDGCLPDVRVVIGDARVRLEGVPDGTYSTLVIDAFNSDAIPVHLLTEEALRLYVRKLAPGGLVALHVSNRHLALEPVLQRIAADLGLAARARGDDGDGPEHLGSNWVVVARSSQDLGVIGGLPDWMPLEEGDVSLWTDDYANVLGALIATRSGGE